MLVMVGFEEFWSLTWKHHPLDLVDACLLKPQTSVEHEKKWPIIAILNTNLLHGAVHLPTKFEVKYLKSLELDLIGKVNGT